MRKGRDDTTKIKSGDDSSYSVKDIRKRENSEYARAADEYERKSRITRSQQQRRVAEIKRKPRTFSQAERRYRDPNLGFDQRYREVNESYAHRYKGPIPDAESEDYGAAVKSKRSRRKEKKKAKRKRSKARKVITAIIVIVVLLLAGLTGYVGYVTSHMDKVKTPASALAIDPQVAKDLRGYRNIAILGVDARSNEPLDGSRTDAIIIMRIAKKSGDVQLISIMRDAYLKMEYTDGTLILDKITHAHHYKGGDDTVAALNRSLDLNIKEYLIFDWQAVADTVDSLGGIEVDVKSNEIRDLNKWGPETGENVGREYKSITETGKQKIDGVQATTYCRIRKTSGGDPGRGERYKKVMSAVMKKALTSPAGMSKLTKDVLPEIRTNMSTGKFVSLFFRAAGMDIKKSYGWPKDYYGGFLNNGIWYAVPTTLEENVQWLHKKAYDQKDYQVSDTCKGISEEITYNTGLY